MNKYRFDSIRSFGLAVAFQLIVSITAYAGIKHDYGTYPVPPAPSLPAAGGIVVDPTFETRIMRLTDANDGPNCITATPTGLPSTLTVRGLWFITGPRRFFTNSIPFNSKS